jgi:hypothetical protein
MRQYVECSLWTVVTGEMVVVLGVPNSRSARGYHGGLRVFSAWQSQEISQRDQPNCMFQPVTQTFGLVSRPIRRLLASHPTLAARFPTVIDFPGYTAVELAAIFGTLAGQAGFALTPGAASQTSTALAGAEDGHGNGKRLAVRLLDQATASHARRVAAASPAQDRPRWARSAPHIRIPGPP